MPTLSEVYTINKNPIGELKLTPEQALVYFSLSITDKPEILENIEKDKFNNFLNIVNENVLQMLHFDGSSNEVKFVHSKITQLHSFLESSLNQNIDYFDELKSLVFEIKSQFIGFESYAKRQNFVEIIREKNGLISDLRILTASCTSIQQIALLSDIERAVTTVKIALSSLGKVTPAIEQRRNMYVARLYDIARFSEDPDAGKIALNTFQQDFIDYEATLIKNRYVQRLFSWGVFFSLIFISFIFLPSVWKHFNEGKSALDLVVQTIFDRSTIQPYLIPLMGACLGAWASFALRTPTLGFKNLSLLEEDRLKPHYKLVFVFALTVITCLILNTGIVQLTISDVKITSKDELGIAFLIGIFCGIAERGISSAIISRADSFASGVQQSTPSVQAKSVESSK